MSMPRTFIIETTARNYVVDPGAGPLTDYDPIDSDPADFGAAIWARIEDHSPIWTDRGVHYFNASHVIAVHEETTK